MQPCCALGATYPVQGLVGAMVRLFPAHFLSVYVVLVRLPLTCCQILCPRDDFYEIVSARMLVPYDAFLKLVPLYCCNELPDDLFVPLLLEIPGLLPLFLCWNLNMGCWPDWLHFGLADPLSRHEALCLFKCSRPGPSHWGS